MVTARTGAAVAAITFSIMTCAPALAQPQMTSQEVIDQIKKKQEELLQQERQWLQQLMQEQQAALAKLKQQQQEEAERKQQQALLEKLKQQQEAKQQQKTTAEKFKELKEAGIFQKAGNTGPNKSGPDDQQLSRDQFAAVIGDALGSFSDAVYANYLQAVQGDPFAPSTQIDPQQLILAMLQGLNGMPGDKPGNPPGDDWAQQYIKAALEKGLLENTQFGEKQLRDDLINEASEAGGSDDGTDYTWDDFPYFAESKFTEVLPEGTESFLVDGKATYNGVVEGTAGDGEVTLTGDSHFDVTFNPGRAKVTGSFDFGDDGSVNLSAGDFDGLLGVTSGAIQDGEVDPDSVNVNAHFYGPNAEEFGGTWGFNVIGGPAQGGARGQFAAKR